MKISKRDTMVTIREWRRIIGNHNYKFTVTQWTDGEAVISVWQSSNRSWLQIHQWRIKNNVVSGTYLRK